MNDKDVEDSKGEDSNSMGEDSMGKVVEHHLDATGLYCPEPVMMLHSKVREMEVGDRLKVVATDPSTQRDIPKFCTFLGHKLIHQAEVEGQYHYILQKGS